MRLATFNLENLFTRPSAMSFDTDAPGREAIADHAIANEIVRKTVYSAADRAKLLELTQKYGWHLLNPPDSALVTLQKIRGQLFRVPQNGPIEVVANSRSDWTGWFELRRQNINWLATENTGRAIAFEARPDVLVTVEVEDRPTLERFNDQVLGAVFDFRYSHVMSVDGNDQRGIDLGILTRFPIDSIRSHVDDDKDGQPTMNPEMRVYSRDCPEYDVLLPSGARLIILANHFKSKRGGKLQASLRRRKVQALRTRAIAQAALTRSPFVAIAGDLNDTPDSEAIAELLTAGFQDVQSHPSYPTDRPGTFETGLADNKIDYLILSPALFARLTQTGIERRGTYHPHTWIPFDTVTDSASQASDHHLLWADLDF